MYTQRRIKQLIGIVVSMSLLLIACTTPATSAPLVSTPTRESVPPTNTLPPTNTPPPMTAQPAPETPVVTEVVTITQEVESLSGDIPGIFAKPLENPSEWVKADDVMATFPMFAWGCENPDLTPIAGSTPEVEALAAAMNDAAAFEQAITDLETQGFVIRVSKPLVYSDEFGNLPIGQTIECRVQQALALFGEAPESLPAEIGMAAVEREGTVDGQKAFERIWLVVWKDESN